jgi:phenylpropionate dioxygenase-like ring-hydroxylating dioxygenase large terminal subunit
MAQVDPQAPPAKTEKMLQALADRSGASQARTLPPGMYCSDEVFALEVEKVFRAGWINVGHVSLVPEPGDFRCVDVVGEALVVVRDRVGELRVLSRVCAHRWMEVCSGSGREPFFECPYHCWTYSLNGRLRSAPFMKRTPGFNAGEIALPQIRHEIWEGFIYVNLDGDAESTATLWSGLSEHLSPYSLAKWKVVSTIDWGRCPWDWKVFMDNGECYHHLGAHRRTLGPILPTRSTKDLPDNGTFTCPYVPYQRADRSRDSRLNRGISTLALTGLRAAAALSPSGAASLSSAVANRLPDSLLGVLGSTSASGAAGAALEHDVQDGLTLAYPFPNYAIALLGDSAFFYEVHPVSAGMIDLKTHLLVPPHVASGAGLRSRIAGHEASFRIVHREDEEICAAVQRTIRSRQAPTGWLGPMEHHNVTFANWYADQMLSGKSIARRSAMLWPSP